MDHGQIISKEENQQILNSAISAISIMNLCSCLVYGNKPFDLHPIEKFNPGIENSNVENSDDLEYDI